MRKVFIFIVLITVFGCRSKKALDDENNGSVKGASTSMDKFKLIDRLEASPSQVRLTEFAPGHPTVNEFPIDQIQNFPTPRYSKGHGLIRNVNWMDLKFFGGAKHPNREKNIGKVIDRAVNINQELALNWNYHLHLGSISSKNAPDSGKEPLLLNSFIQLANKYPNIPRSAIVNWGQTGSFANGNWNPKSIHSKQDFPNKYYIRDTKGNFVNRKGKVAKSKRKFYSYCVPEKEFYPDGNAQAQTIKSILKRLDGGIAIINENGETQPAYIKDAIIKQSKEMTAQMKQMGITDLETYRSTRKTQIRKAYADRFMKRIPELKNTTFSWYAVEGGIIDRYDWSISKKILTPINGQYYSTPNFYPKTPEVWSRIRGHLHGWNWIQHGRISELKDGDKLFSPFVAAGWHLDPEKNFRPGQWLGLLKCLGVVGAEFYYTGHFSVRKPPYPLPENYAWQATAPSYAQAITSRYEDILRNGNVLFDKEGTPILRFSNDQEDQVLVTVRKHDSKPHYIICGTVQTYDNKNKTAPLKTKVEINLQGKDIILPVRRQGSTYFLDFSNPERPVLKQLDTWHQAYHPAWWSDGFLFEAEVMDNNPGKIPVTTTVRKLGHKLDFSSFNTYISLNQSNRNAPEYDVSPRKNQTALVFVRAKTSEGGTIEVSLAGRKVSAQVKTSDWQWIAVNTEAIPLQARKYSLSIKTTTGKVDVDKIWVSVDGKQPDLKYWQMDES